MNLRGTFTAMITPFLNDQIDEKGLEHNIHRQIQAGITGLVFLGSTGESETLTEKERHRITEIGISNVKGKAIVLVGTGCVSTRETIDKTKTAHALGADAALIVTPYYNKPTQEGIYRHFEAIANQVDIPILIYNNQARTAVNIETPTLLRIAALPNVVGVKEASGNILQVGDVLHSVVSRYPGFNVLSGDDILTLPMMALGATGLISIVGNLIPEQVIALVNAALEGRFFEARRVHEELLSLFKLSVVEVNPMPIKEAMLICGIPSGSCRLPLCEMRQENRERLHQLLKIMQLR